MTNKHSKEAIEKASEVALSNTSSPRYRHIKAILTSSGDKVDKRDNTAEAKGILKGVVYFASLGGADNA